MVSVLDPPDTEKVTVTDIAPVIVETASETSSATSINVPAGLRPI